MENSDCINFLTDVIKDLEDNNVDESKLNLIEDFQLKYTIGNNLFDKSKQYSDRDFFAFLLMSWYVYKIISANSDNNNEMIDK
jgi:hypothetical protein